MTSIDRNGIRAPLLPFQPLFTEVKCVEGFFCELRVDGFLRSSFKEVATRHTKICRVAYMLCPATKLQSGYRQAGRPPKESGRLSSCPRR